MPRTAPTAKIAMEPIAKAQGIAISSGSRPRLPCFGLTAGGRQALGLFDGGALALLALTRRAAATAISPTAIASPTTEMASRAVSLRNPLTIALRPFECCPTYGFLPTRPWCTEG